MTLRRSLLLVVSFALVAGACGGRARFVPLARAEPSTTAPTTTTTTTTEPPTTTTAPAPTTTARPRPRPTTTAAPKRTRDTTAYRGLGTWVDRYDWSRQFTGGHPDVGPADVDRMAAAGVQTLYLQAAKWDAPGDVAEPDLLLPIIDRAHARGIRVVAWYLPTLTDPDADFRHVAAIAALHVEGVAIDIESRAVGDVAERNRRLVAFSARLRSTLGGRAIGGIVLPPVVMEVVNPNYWPGFPWRGIAPYYDVWLPMAYWTWRTQQSGYHDGFRYTAENVTRLRADLGLPGAPVHPIGGISDTATAAEVDGMVRADAGAGALGGSMYDWHSTPAALYPHLTPLRR